MIATMAELPSSQEFSEHEAEDNFRPVTKEATSHLSNSGDVSLAETVSGQGSDEKPVRLWNSYLTTRLNEDRVQLFEHYRYLSKAQSKRYSKSSMPYRSLVDPDDIEAYADIGLWEAIESYDPSKGTTFKTHSYRRIKGAIIDGLRSLQNFPRVVSRIKREIAPLIQMLTHELLREPTLEEVCARFPDFMVGDAKLSDFCSDTLISISVFNQSQDSQEDCDAIPGSIGSLFEQSLQKHRHNPVRQPFDRLQRIDLIDKVFKILEGDEKERKVLYCYYFLGMTSNEISKVTSLSETWVSVKKQMAIEKLKKHARRDPELAEQLMGLY